MNNVRVVLNTFGDKPEELYFVPKEGCILEQKIVEIGKTTILKLYLVYPGKHRKWYQLSDHILVELLLTIDMCNVKYVIYDE